MDGTRYSTVKLLKRYTLSCLIALFIFSGIVGYRHPTNDRIGALVVMAAVWPVVMAFALGGAIGAVARAHTDEVIA